MTLRITTANAFSTSVETLQRRQQDLTTAQERLTSGKRVARASDDPAAAARVERALAATARTDASQRALQASRNVMQQAESTLGSATDLVQQVRELVVGAGNASYSDADRASLGAQVRGLRDQLLSLANRGDGTGGYLFGGQGSAQPPFVDAPGGVVYRGVGGQRQVSAGDTLPMSLDGGSGWLRSASGNGVFLTAPAPGNSTGAWVDAGQVVDPSALSGDSYSVAFSVSGSSTTYAVLKGGAPTAIVNQPYVAGQAIAFDGMSLSVSGVPADGDRFDATPSQHDLSIFDVLDRIANDLQTGNRSNAQVTQTVQSGLRDIDAAFGGLQRQRAAAGQSLNQLDGVEQRLADVKLAAQTDRSNAEDLDMVHALSDFQNQQTGYDAALKTYSMVQRLSLFQYLNG